jgi:hypothetical protein
MLLYWSFRDIVDISYLYGRDGLIIDAMVIFFEDRNFAYISGWSFANESVSNLDSFFANLFQETTPFISSSFMEKGKSLPSPELIVNLAQALEADVVSQFP